MRTAAAVVIFLTLLGCSADPAGTFREDPYQGPLIAFNDFPDSLFYGLYPGQPINGVKNNLVENGFVAIDSSGSFRYLLTSDSTQVIIPYHEELTEFKIILRSSVYLGYSAELQALFRSNAASFDETEVFSTYSIQRSEAGLRVSFFRQGQLIRVHFERQGSH